MEALNISPESSEPSKNGYNYFPILVFYVLVLYDFTRDTLNGLMMLLLNTQANYSFPLILKFFDYTNKELVAGILLVAGVIITFTAVVKPHSQSARVSSAIYFIVSKGFIFSATRYNHYYIPMMWALLCLSLYSPIDSKEGQLFFKKVYSLCLFSIASFYTFPGVWKFVFGLTQGTLTKSAFGANTIAFFFLTQGQESSLGPILIEYPNLTYLGFLGVIFFQISSIYAWYNQKYQRLWALGILAFHIISIFALNVNFFVAGMVTFIFFYLSPFIDRKNDWLAMLMHPLNLLKIRKSSPS